MKQFQSMKLLYLHFHEKFSSHNLNNTKIMWHKIFPDRFYWKKWFLIFVIIVDKLSIIQVSFRIDETLDLLVQWFICLKLSDRWNIKQMRCRCMTWVLQVNWHYTAGFKKYFCWVFVFVFSFKYKQLEKQEASSLRKRFYLLTF